MAISHREKIIVLWIVFLLGTLFHTQLGLMPLFHNQRIIIDDNPAGNIDGILWSMLAFFGIPMLLTVATLFMQSKRYRQAHWGVTLIYSGLNLIHTIADLLVQPIDGYQIALMVMLFLIGLLLNWVAFQWWRESCSRKQRLDQTLV